MNHRTHQPPYFFQTQYVYFNFLRGLVLDGMVKKHLAAKKHLGEVREFA
jgi:hypothetical protein